MKEQKKVALLIPNLCGGGAERLVVNFANELANLNYQVDLVVVNAYGPYKSQVSNKVNIIDLKSKRVLFSIFKLRSYLKHQKPDVVYSALFHMNLGAMIANFLLQNKTKLIISTHIALSVSLKNINPIMARLFIIAMRYFYPKAFRVIAVSNGVAADLKNIIPKCNNIVVIYNAAIRQEMMQKSLENINHSWISTKKDPVILTIGRLTAQKNHSMLLHSFAKLKRNLPAKLIILGEGELRTQLQQEIDQLNLTKDVDMPGFVNNPYPYLKNCDLFVLSSDYEGFGIVLAEALALGARVVSTDCPHGPREVLHDSEYGTLVKVGDVDGLAEAMGKSLRSEPIKIDNEYLNKFRIEKFVQQHLDIFF